MKWWSQLIFQINNESIHEQTLRKWWKINTIRLTFRDILVTCVCWVFGQKKKKKDVNSHELRLMGSSAVCFTPAQPARCSPEADGPARRTHCTAALWALVHRPEQTEEHGMSGRLMLNASQVCSCSDRSEFMFCVCNNLLSSGNWLYFWKSKKKKESEDYFMPKNTAKQQQRQWGRKLQANIKKRHHDCDSSHHDGGPDVGV